MLLVMCFFFCLSIVLVSDIRDLAGNKCIHFCMFIPWIVVCVFLRYPEINQIKKNQKTNLVSASAMGAFRGADLNRQAASQACRCACQAETVLWQPQKPL